MAAKATSLDELLVAELEPVAAGNRKTVREFYKALASNEAETISRLVASDIEWWYHGPPHCQHMMKMLTGESKRLEFKFKPRNITTLADRVIVEGWRGSSNHAYYWVHVGTREDGMMTKLLQHFDMWVTVIVRVPYGKDGDHDHHDHEIVRLWQRQPKELCDRSLPDVALPL